MLNDDTPEETMMKALMGRSGEEGCAMEMLRESLAEYTNVVEVDEDEQGLSSINTYSIFLRVKNIFSTRNLR